jgi:hypothetical protein
MVNLNSNNDKKLGFFKEIKDIQVKLFRPGIENEFQSQELKNKFIDYRLKWSDFVEKVEIDIANVLVNQLERNEGDFKDGIEAINQEIKKINDAVVFLNLLGRTIGILGKIIQLAI